MSYAKLLRLPELLFLGMMFVAQGSVLAQTPTPYERATVPLAPMATGVSASGTATLSSVHFDGWTFLDYDGPNWVEEYTGYLTITCKGLKPRTSYLTTLGVMKTDARGNGAIAGWWYFGFVWWLENSQEYDPSGQVFQVYVSERSRSRLLSGEFPWQYYQPRPGWPQ